MSRTATSSNKQPITETYCAALEATWHLCTSQDETGSFFRNESKLKHIFVCYITNFCSYSSEYTTFWTPNRRDALITYFLFNFLICSQILHLFRTWCLQLDLLSLNRWNSRLTFLPFLKGSVKKITKGILGFDSKLQPCDIIPSKYISSLIQKMKHTHIL